MGIGCCLAVSHESADSSHPSILVLFLQEVHVRTHRQTVLFNKGCVWAHLSGFAARRRPTWFWQAQLVSPQQRTVSSGPQELWPRAKKSAAPATCWVHESAFVSVLSHRITRTKGPSTPHPIAQFSSAQSRGWHSQKEQPPTSCDTHTQNTHTSHTSQNIPKHF